jgi:hypothetical protein
MFTLILLAMFQTGYDSSSVTGLIDAITYVEHSTTYIDAFGHLDPVDCRPCFTVSDSIRWIDGFASVVYDLINIEMNTPDSPRTSWDPLVRRRIESVRTGFKVLPNPTASLFPITLNCPVSLEFMWIGPDTLYLEARTLLRDSIANECVPFGFGDAEIIAYYLIRLDNDRIKEIIREDIIAMREIR